MLGVVGQPIVTELVPPAGVGELGARIEVPVTRAIVSAWQPATLITDPDTLTSAWRVSLESPVAAGDYQLVWRTPDPEPPLFEAFIPLSVVTAVPGAAVTTSQWAPTVQDVADLCPAYTRAPIDSDGASAGSERRVFDDQTNPTYETVQRFIEAAVEEVAGRAGAPITARTAGLAQRAAVWHAAAAVEAERMPGGVDDAEGAYRWKQASYIACLNELIAQARASGALRLN